MHPSGKAALLEPLSHVLFTFQSVSRHRLKDSFEAVSMASSEDDKRAVPEANESDKLHLTARSLVSMIPVLGGAARELLSFVWVPSLERRRVRWMNTVAERLKQLETDKKGFRLEELRDDPLFITILTEAFRIALRTHHQEKLGALHNAVLNTALKINIEDDTQQIFLEHVDSFTPSHLKVLDFLSGPPPTAGATT